jgi:hypothetical protein
LDFPALAERIGIHEKTLYPMFGAKENPTASKLFNLAACLQENEGVRFRVAGWAYSLCKAAQDGAPATIRRYP